MRALLLGVLLSLICAPAISHARDKAAPLFEDALARYERKDLNGALIQLKNALQQDPKYLAAHVLSGRILLQLGRSSEAELSFSTALDLGVDRGEVLPLLGQAMLEQGKYKPLLDRIDPAGLAPGARVEALVLRAYAYMDLNDLRAAERAIEEAARLDPRAVAVPIAGATLALRRQDWARSKALAAQAVTLGPNDARAWNIRGAVSHGLGDASAALADYARALAIDPDFVEARLARTALLLDLGRDKDAASELTLLRKNAPQDPRVNYLRALQLYRGGDQAGARAALAEAGAGVDALPGPALERKPQYLLIGGVAYTSLGQQEKAKSYLQRFLQANPGDLPARRLLAAIYLTEKDFMRVTSLLEPVVKANGKDSYALSMLATAYMGLNRPQSAADMLERALRVGELDAPTRASLGFTLLGTGKSDAGLEHLRRAFQADPRQVRVGTALVVLDLKRGDTKSALKTAETLLKQDANNAVIQNLVGVVRAAAGDRAGARTAYERALALDKSMRPAALNLAKLDVGEGKFEAARARLMAMHKGQPNDQQAMLELARLERASGRSDEARRWYEKLLALNARHFLAGIELADLLIANRNATQAVVVAKAIEAKAPERLDVLAALGRAYLANGEFQNARGIFDRMGRLATLDSGQQLQLARYQLMAGNPQGARFNLEKILAADPESVAAEAMLVELDLAANNPAQAEQRARAIKSRPGHAALGHRLSGDVAMARQKYGAAIEEYEAALARQRDSDTLIRLALAQQQAGQGAQAIALLERGRSEFSGNEMIDRALAEAYLRASDWSRARATYESLLKRHPDDVAILNNLAYTLQRQKDPAALGLAERAHRLAPEDAAVNDTLGWLLVQSGQTERGLRYLREARLRDPHNPDIRYHLAHALAQAGRRSEARSELEVALQAGQNFQYLSAAQQLARQLSGP